MYVLDGHNGYRFFSDLYRLNLITLEWKKLKMEGKVPSERACFHG